MTADIDKKFLIDCLVKIRVMSFTPSGLMTQPPSVLFEILPISSNLPSFLLTVSRGNPDILDSPANLTD